MFDKTAKLSYREFMSTDGDGLHHLLWKRQKYDTHAEFQGSMMVMLMRFITYWFL